jgi:hypothetical protein
MFLAAQIVGDAQEVRGAVFANTPMPVEDNGTIVISAANTEEGETLIDYQIGDFTWHKVSIEGINHWQLTLGDESNIKEKGAPNLPNICRSIIVPDDLEMSVQVTSSRYQDYENVVIAPSKGIILRTVDPAQVPFEFGTVYDRDEWYPAQVASLEEPYILRDYRGQVVKVNPFQYNPVRGILRVYSEISIEVSPAGQGEVNIIDRTSQPEVIDTDFARIYEDHFLNFMSGRYTPVEEQGTMLVITYDSFASEMQPYVDWKNMMGVPTQMVNVSEIGSSASAIQSYIADMYNDSGLTFVLLVGDAAQIPTITIWGNDASDPSYSYVAGNDHYPDLFVGRFSAQNTTQLSTQVERSLEYERYPQAGADWYAAGAGLASNQGPGDDNEYDYQHIRNIRTDLINYTYLQVAELYDGSQGGEDAPGNPTPSMVSSVVNAGVSVINYCGHGSSTSWGTSGFSNTNINALTNDNLLPFIWSVACVNGNFNNYSACFAEAWMRATNGSEPTGAIATFMSSINQSWDPPMDAQDEFDDLLVESYVNNVKHTFGGISFHGCMHMNDEYGGAGEDMTDTWHVFGDPSLVVRTMAPAELSVTHEGTVPLGSTELSVQVSNVEGALCAISMDAQLLGYAYTDGSGNALIQLSNPLEEGFVDLVVTAYNSIPYEAEIEVMVMGDIYYFDNEDAEFQVLSGTWNTANHPNAYEGSTAVSFAGTGSGRAGWRVDQALPPGVYNVYTWKFEHNFMHLMATNAHFRIFHANGVSSWVIADQSASGNQWVYLGNYEFDTSGPQGILVTDEADGFIAADAVRLIFTGN